MNRMTCRCGFHVFFWVMLYCRCCEIFVNLPIFTCRFMAM